MEALRSGWAQKDLEPGTMLWWWRSTTGYCQKHVDKYVLHALFLPFALVCVQVGPLGFMCLDTDEAAGNMGMLDQGEILCN